MPSEVVMGEQFVVDGRLVRHHHRQINHRKIWLQRTNMWHEWRPYESVRTDASGRFQITVDAADGYKKQSFRIVVPSRRGQTRLQSPATRVATIPYPEQPTFEVPAGDWDPAEYPDPHSPKPAGQPTDWTHIHADGLRWDPCRTIRWAYNPTGSYRGSLQDATRAIARVAGVSGYHFRYVGETSYVPWDPDQPAEFPHTTADLAIGWSNRSEIDQFVPGVIGLGGGETSTTTDPTGASQTRITRGLVTLNTGFDLDPGFSGGGDTTWGQVMTHEILHAIGLGHATSTTQLMSPSLGSKNHRFGAGDLTGITHLGIGAGCIPTPPTSS